MRGAGGTTYLPSPPTHTHTLIQPAGEPGSLPGERCLQAAHAQASRVGIDITRIVVRPCARALLLRSPAGALALACIVMRLPAGIRPAPLCRLYACHLPGVVTDFELAVRRTPFPLARIQQEVRAAAARSAPLVCLSDQPRAAAAAAGPPPLVLLQPELPLLCPSVLHPSGPGVVGGVPGALRRPPALRALPSRHRGGAGRPLCWLLLLRGECGGVVWRRGAV